ncbi:MAG: hypothetical protein JSV35_06495 [Candidatus Bathyarchaeota archaeon]|nr:MAG: hypothetical protein JSV35_06495 [Candidatus Bathyarchaeota archaeon]
MKGRRRTYLSYSLILGFLLFALPPLAFATKGPRMDNLLIKYYASVEAAYDALKASEIDVVGYELTDVLYADAVTDPNICLGQVADQGMYEFDLNSNHTISSYPGVESFIYGKKRSGVRKAITYLVNKDLIVSDCCGGFAERIDQLLGAPHKGWRNQTHPGWGSSSFVYEYNPDTAAALLDAEGFVQGTTPNPAFNPLISWSAEFLRVYPDDHPTHAGSDVHPILMYIRTDDVRRNCAGNDLKYHLETIGFKVSCPVYWVMEMWPIIMDIMDFHIYTGSWSLGRFPSLYQYGLMHSSQWYPYGSNYITGVDIAGDPNFPDLDASLLEGLTATTHSAAGAAVKKSSGLAHFEYCVNVPLWSSANYWAWKSSVKGVVNAEGAGPENGYSFMNMYKTDGTTLVYGLKTIPVAMNKIYSSWYYDYQCLDRMELYGNGITVAPYDLAIDQNAFITSWQTGTYIDYDTGAEQFMNAFTYRSDGYAVEPVTGNVVEHLNATQVYASIWYMYQTPDTWHFSYLPSMIDHLNITDNDCSIEMYWCSLNYWNTYYGGTAILSFDWLTTSPLSTFHTEDIAWPGGAGMDWVGLANQHVFWIERTVTLDGTPLVQGVDYEIYTPCSGSIADGDMRLITPTAAGTLHVEYWVVGDAHGYTPGNLPWQTSFQGAGAFYATDFVAGAGGYIALAANRQYYMETPPLGEIDFVRKSNGCYRVDIFDVVIVASAYGSTGGGLPDSNWFPGADLVLDGGRVDIFDIVTITSNYGLDWDCPPSYPPP